MTQLGCQGDPLGIVQEIKIWSCEQMVYSQPRISPVKWEEQSPVGFMRYKRIA